MESTKEDNTEKYSNEELFKIENALKEELTTQLTKVFNNLLSSSKEEEKQFFNNKNIAVLNSLIDWNLNVNTVKANKGEFSTNYILKFYHYIFSSFDDSEDKSILEKFNEFKSEFIKKMNIELIKELNDNKNKEMIIEYDLKNGYINIFLTDKYKAIIELLKKDKKKQSEFSNTQFTMESIGTLECCFPEKFSVPRQGNLIDLTRGKIIINKNIDMSSFDGIENFTYIWVVYIFHLHQGFNGSKIHPPKYENGKKLGVFATRTPHRINSIGLTLCKFDRIENNEIFISCIDMVSGTPIIDIKPYHHLESVDVFAPGMKYPDWIKNADKGIKAKVTILPEAEKNLDDILSTKKLIFYSKKEELLPLIKGVLEIDPHSKYTKKKQGTLLYAFHLDKLNVIYEYNAQKGEIVVHEIEYSEEYKKLRNKEWTENYKHHTTKDEK